MRLEALRPDHAAELFTVLSDERIYRFLDYGPPASVVQLEALYTRLQAGGSADGREVWLNHLVRLDEDGAAIGYVQATVLPGSHAWVAYVFDPRQWGRGLAQEAMRALLSHLRQHHPVPRWMAVIEAGNVRSQALLQRLGFTLALAGEPQAAELTANERLYLRASEPEHDPRI